jgi:hypothetical protein
MYYEIGNKAKVFANLTVQKLRQHRQHGMSFFFISPRRVCLRTKVITLPNHLMEKSVKNVAELHTSFCCKEWLGKCNVQ